MKLLSINSNPYTIDVALFDTETRRLIRYGTSFYKSKDKNERLILIKNDINELLDEMNPTIVVTQMLDLKHTMKRDLEHIVAIRTILRLVCGNRNIMYNEFRDIGWQKRLTNMKRPSKKAKLKIVREYSAKIDREEIADAIILAEGIVWNRIQIGE